MVNQLLYGSKYFVVTLVFLPCLHARKEIIYQAIEYHRKRSRKVVSCLQEKWYFLLFHDHSQTILSLPGIWLEVLESFICTTFFSGNSPSNSLSNRWQCSHCPGMSCSHITLSRFFLLVSIYLSVLGRVGSQSWHAGSLLWHSDLLRWHMDISLIVTPRVSRCPSWAQLPHSMRGLSSLTRGQTPIPCTERQILNHWTPGEVSSLPYLLKRKKKKKTFHIGNWLCNRYLCPENFNPCLSHAIDKLEGSLSFQDLPNPMALS